MSSPRHSPPPSSAAAPKPKGILKNASERSVERSVVSGDEQDGAGGGQVDEHGNRLQWDETNLTLHEIERENMEARMKIDEPKTPFVRGRELDDGSGMDFDLDGGSPHAPLSSTSGSGSRRSSNAAEQLAANTVANANLGRAATRRTSSSGGSVGLAVGLDSADLRSSAVDASDSVSVSGSSSSRVLRSDSRSPSFSLPSSRRSSASRTSSRGALNGDSRSDVREESQRRADGYRDLDAETGQDETFDPDNDEEGELDPEVKAKQEAFAAKRNQHYGNEAEAMKIAAALAAQEDDEDDNDEDGDAVMTTGDGVPPIPRMPNGIH